MAAEIVAELAPMVKGGAVSTAQRVVDVMKEKNLAAEPGLLVPLNAALGEMVPIKPTKVRFIFLFMYSSRLFHKLLQKVSESFCAQLE